jgi:hypothetical protein
MRNRRIEASVEDERRGNPTPHPGAPKQQPEDQPEEAHEEHGEVMGRIHQVARRVLLDIRSRIRRRMVLVNVARRSLGSGTKVQGPEDPVTQKERAREEERQKDVPRTAESGAHHRDHSTVHHVLVLRGVLLALPLAPPSWGFSSSSRPCSTSSGGSCYRPASRARGWPLTGAKASGRGGVPPPYSPNRREKLSEKVSEWGFDHAFCQRGTAKQGLLPHFVRP